MTPRPPAQLCPALQIALLGDLKSHSQSINNIIILLANMFIFYLQYVESMRIERFRTFVKHHSTVEKYMANVIIVKT